MIGTLKYFNMYQKKIGTAILFVVLTIICMNSNAKDGNLFVSKLDGLIGNLVPKCGDKKWKSSEISFAMAPVVARAELILKSETPRWNDNAYLDFSKTGQRNAGEQMIFARQKPLAYLVLAECYEGKGRFLSKINDVLLALSTQPSWTLPAHDYGLSNLKSNFTVDLNASDLAHDIAWALRIFGDSITPSTRIIALQALDDRVFQPVLRSLADQKQKGTALGPHSWLNSKSNWNAVCLAGIVGAAVVSGRQDYKFWLDLGRQSIENYLAGFSEDGYADEGVNYWNYGFGHFLTLRETIYFATSGRMDLAVLPKVSTIARYPALIEMWPGIAAPFGDTGLETMIDPIVRGHADFILGQISINEWRKISRNLIGIKTLNENMWRLWGGGRPISSQISSKPTTCSLFENAGVAVFRSSYKSDAPLAMTIRLGGSKSHAHDDAGSYSVALGPVQITGDLGSPAYTREMFGSKRRENLLVNSWGHPVPRVNDVLQLNSTTHKANWIGQSPCQGLKTNVNVQEAEMDLTPVYDSPGLNVLKRHFKFNGGEEQFIELSDVLDSDQEVPFETAIVTHGQVSFEDDRILIKYKDQKIIIDVNASDDYHFITSNVFDDSRNKFTRIAIRLRAPHKKACIGVMMGNGLMLVKNQKLQTVCFKE